MNPITVLSVRQPHADALIYGDKFVENRSWSTKFRGRLYIHASSWDSGPKTSDGPGLTGHIIGSVEVFDVVDIDDLDMLSLVPQNPTAKQLAKCDKILPGTSKVLERLPHIHKLLADINAEQYEKHVCGNFCWLVRDAQPLKKPIPALGKLNLWKYDGKQLAKV